MIPTAFRGRALPLTDLDIATVGRRIGVGEDEVRAVIEVETAGGGYDRSGRPKMLFEPHVFWRELGPGPSRTAAEAQGLAYPRWGTLRYPADSYPRLERAMAISPAAALRSASWGLGQVMGFNHRAAGFSTPGDMVAAICDSEVAGLEAMLSFIESEGLDDDLRRHDWSGFARGYNGPGYATNGYHTRLAAAFARWQGIPDLLAPAQPNIGMGSRGAAVRLAQEQLVALDYDPRGADGIFGPGTAAAVRKFQSDRGLTPDGICGPITWAALTTEN